MNINQILSSLLRNNILLVDDGDTGENMNNHYSAVIIQPSNDRRSGGHNQRRQYVPDSQKCCANDEIINKLIGPYHRECNTQNHHSSVSDAVHKRKRSQQHDVDNDDNNIKLLNLVAKQLESSLNKHKQTESSSSSSSSHNNHINKASTSQKTETRIIKDGLLFLIFGARGFIGTHIVEILTKLNIPFKCVNTRIENRESVVQVLNDAQPTHVINCAGVTGKKSVDDCESMKQDTILSNVIGTLNLIDACWRGTTIGENRGKPIHVTNFATGCIYEYTSPIPNDYEEYLFMLKQDVAQWDAKNADMSSTSEKCAYIEGSREYLSTGVNSRKPRGDFQGSGFREIDEPNFAGSHYSKTKIAAEKMLAHYDNVLTLRIRMPLSDSLQHSRNFISKIIKYEKVVNIPNSMTVLSDLLPVSIDMALNRHVGVFNFTNPGVISHNEILQMYKKYIDPSYKWSNFTVEEQSKILVAKRSNNRLDVSKLLQLYPSIPNIKQACEMLFHRMSFNQRIHNHIMTNNHNSICKTRLNTNAAATDNTDVNITDLATNTPAAEEKTDNKKKESCIITDVLSDDECDSMPNSKPTYDSNSSSSSGSGDCHFVMDVNNEDLFNLIRNTSSCSNNYCGNDDNTITTAKNILDTIYKVAGEYTSKQQQQQQQ